MRSFLREMEERFVELENHCDVCDKPSDQCTCDEEIDEQNVTGAVAGYNTPAAFRKTVKHVGYASGLEESAKPVSKTYKPGHYQTVEFDEEVQNDKFSFSLDDAIWWNKDMEYPSKDKTNTPGTAHKKDHDAKTRNQKAKTKITVEDIVEQKYEQLIEGYRTFATADSKTSPEQKVKNTIKEVARKLQEIETMVNHNARLKTESGVTSSAYGNSTKKALAKISERLVKISERVRALGE